MPTILIAHRNAAFREQRAAELRAAGYRVNTCPGPRAFQSCIRCDAATCPLTAGADLMLYDPYLSQHDAEGERYNLAVAASLAHPGVPVLLAWPAAETPTAGTLRPLRERAPHLGVAELEPAALARQVANLVPAGPAAAGPTR